MDKARKPDRARPQKGADPSTSNPPRREVRVNRRALVLVVLAGVLAVPALLGLKALQDRWGRSALLLEAKKQRDEARRPDLALGYFNRYLELAPDDLDALDQRAALLAEAAREQVGDRLGHQGPHPPARQAGGRPRVGGDPQAAGRALPPPGPGVPGRRANHPRPPPARARRCRRPTSPRLEPSKGPAAWGTPRFVGGRWRHEAAEVLQPRRRRLGRAAGEPLPRQVQTGRGRPGSWTPCRAQPAIGRRQAGPVAVLRLTRRRSGGLGRGRRECSGSTRADVDARLAAAEAAVKRNDPAVASRHLDAIQPARPDDLRVKILRGQIEPSRSRKTGLAIRDWQDGLALANGGDAELTWRLSARPDPTRPALARPPP